MGGLILYFHHVSGPPKCSVEFFEHPSFEGYRENHTQSGNMHENSTPIAYAFGKIINCIVFADAYGAYVVN